METVYYGSEEIKYVEDAIKKVDNGENFETVVKELNKKLEVSSKKVVA